MEKLDSLSKDLCMYITHDNDESCIDMDLMDALGIKPFTRGRSLEFISEFSQDHDVRTERIIDTTVWKNRDEAETRYVRMTNGSPESVDRVKKYFDENDPTGTSMQRSKLIVYWHTKRTEHDGRNV